MKPNGIEKFIIILLFNVVNFISQTTCSSISSKFSQYEIVPQIILSSPKELLQVIYSDKYQANLGNPLPPLAVFKAPVLKWKANPKQFYLLVMIDPDIPFPGVPQLFHWVVGNIPGDDLTKGTLLANYIPPTPPPGTGPHRYILFIFKQPKKLPYKFNVFVLLLRMFPSLQTALKIYGINSSPLAGNFYLSETKIII